MFFDNKSITKINTAMDNAEHDEHRRSFKLFKIFVKTYSTPSKQFAMPDLSKWSPYGLNCGRESVEQLVTE